MPCTAFAMFAAGSGVQLICTSPRVTVLGVVGVGHAGIIIRSAGRVMHRVVVTCVTGYSESETDLGTRSPGRMGPSNHERNEII